ncbi:MAG: hypothetical protein HY329_05270 [Chloroflexi bacterium]|nr:hypothetical protein [Chloroflexota bacterium]
MAVNVSEIQPGALVEATDYPVGPVEQVDTSGQGESFLLVRHGRADFLLRIPERHIAEHTSGRVRLDMKLEDVEALAIASRTIPEAGKEILDAGPIGAGPHVDEVLGGVPGSSPLGPATG